MAEFRLLDPFYAIPAPRNYVLVFERQLFETGQHDEIHVTFLLPDWHLHRRGVIRVTKT
jgi:hypothetical protein